MKDNQDARKDVEKEEIEVLEGKEEIIDENNGDIRLKPKHRFWKKIPGFGFILILIALIIQNFTNLLVKQMTSIDPLVLLFYRSIFIFIVTMPWAVLKEKPPFPPGQSNADRLRLLYRGIIGCLNMWAGFYSLR